MKIYKRNIFQCFKFIFIVFAISLFFLQKVAGQEEIERQGFFEIGTGIGLDVTGFPIWRTSGEIFLKRKTSISLFRSYSFNKNIPMNFEGGGIGLKYEPFVSKYIRIGVGSELVVRNFAYEFLGYIYVTNFQYLSIPVEIDLKLSECFSVQFGYEYSRILKRNNRAKFEIQLLSVQIRYRHMRPKASLKRFNQIK